ncbi:MAG: FkbM family methyltransferase [Anaeromyxobacter sp.]
MNVSQGSKELDSPDRARVARFETATGVYFLPTDAPGDVVIAAIKAGQMFEPHIIQAASEYITRDTVVLDVGANFGQMAMAFARAVGPGGRVYAFEADTFIAKLLQDTLVANGSRNVVPVCHAVWDTCGEKKFYPEPDFKRFSSYGSYGLDPRAQAGRVVETITIDSLDIRDPVSFMKVDIQGSDLFALRGARETIRRHQMPILFEYEEQFQKEFGTCLEDYLAFIDSIGYRTERIIDGINYLIVPRARSSSSRGLRVNRSAGDPGPHG